MKRSSPGTAGLIAAMRHRRGDDYVAGMAGLKIAGVEDDNDIDGVFGSKPGAGELDAGMLRQVGPRGLRRGIIAAVPVLHGVCQHELPRRLDGGRFALAPAEQKQGRHRGSNKTRARHAPMLVQFLIARERKSVGFLDQLQSPEVVQMQNAEGVLLVVGHH